jgi:hypothetical protein
MRRAWKESKIAATRSVQTCTSPQNALSFLQIAFLSSAFHSPMSFIASAPSGTSSASSAPLSSFTLPRAIDDFHLHIRDGDAILRDVLRPMLTRRTVARAILMPNLQPPVTNAKMALEYRERVRNAVGEIQQEMQTAGTEKGGATAATTSASSSSPRIDFTPLMTLYLTDATTPDEIKEAK